MKYFFSILALVIALASPSIALCDDWLSMETVNFKIFFKNGDQETAKILAPYAENARRRTVNFIGYDFKHKTRVYLAPDRESYNSVQPRSIIPEWSVGVAFTKENIIVIYTTRARAKYAPNYDMYKVFQHELSHIVMGRAMARNNVPRWLDEGIAQFLAVEWTNSDTFRLTIAYIMGNLIPLEELFYSWPKEGRKARLAYLQSRTLVGYLARNGNLGRIITYIREGKTADQAIMMTTGMTISQLEKEWKHHMGRIYTWLFLVFRPEVIWTIMVLIFFAAYWKVRTRSKKKLKRMAMEDELEDLQNGNDPRTYH